MLIAALLATVALAPQAEVDRFPPVSQTTLTLAHKRMAVSQGGQRIRVTIPATPGVYNAYGDRFSYQWDTAVDGGARCQPGALPDLTNVTAGTVIDAPLPRPPKSWCRGMYRVTLEAVTTFNCAVDPPFDCDYDNGVREDDVAYATFDVGPPPKMFCHEHGKVSRCWFDATFRDRAVWHIWAPLDDLLGPDGATSDADPYFDRAFRRHKRLRDNWETDDNDIYAWATKRADAIRIAEIIDRVLRAGPYARYDRAAEAAR